MYSDDEIDNTIEETIKDINCYAHNDEFHFSRGLARHGELNKYFLREAGHEGMTAYFEYEKDEDTVYFKFCRLNSRMMTQHTKATGFVEISDTVIKIAKFLLGKDGSDGGQSPALSF